MVRAEAMVTISIMVDCFRTAAKFGSKPLDFVVVGFLRDSTTGVRWFSALRLG